MFTPQKVIFFSGYNQKARGGEFFKLNKVRNYEQTSEIQKKKLQKNNVGNLDLGEKVAL